jgi:hypothetical protein
MKKYLMMLLALWMGGCGEPTFQTQESAYIIWKSPTLRYADQGFIYHGDAVTRVEIYGSGEALMRLDIGKESVCSSFLSCLPLKRFNAEVLSSAYPEHLLAHVFNAEKIFGGMGMVRKRNGFTQKITEPKKYNIDYRVLNNETVFHDTINGITIKIKRIRG